jgi:hypothetical protein
MKKISSIILALILLIGGVVPYASEVSAAAVLLPTLCLGFARLPLKKVVVGQ